MNNLSSSLFKQIHFRNHDENFCFSPASYISALNVLSFCLKDANYKELLDASELNQNGFNDQSNFFKLFLNGLENYNQLFYSDEYFYALDSESLSQIEDYGAEIDSFNQNDLDNLIIRINQTVSEKTHGKIQNLISRQDLSNLTSLVILNCLYLKKEWLHKFNIGYGLEIFYGKKEKTFTKFLKLNKNLSFYEDDELDIVELPYQDSNICCYILVPKTSIFDILNNLKVNYDKINLAAPQENTKVDLSIPAFKIESEFDLVNMTKNAGLKRIFEYNKDWNLFDFNKLKPEAVMKVDKIIQKTFFDFTKDGTEAAAATICLINCSGYSPMLNVPIIKYIRADKPFIYILADKNDKNTPLFIGVVNNIEELKEEKSYQTEYLSSWYYGKAA